MTLGGLTQHCYATFQAELDHHVDSSYINAFQEALCIPQSDFTYSGHLSKMSLALTIYHFAFQGLRALPIATSSGEVEPSHSAPSI